LTGERSSEAGKRRQHQRLQEDKSKKEQKAVFRAMVTGQSNIRKGRFWLE
jgi:hypothetical protein